MILLVLLAAFPVFHVPSGRITYSTDVVAPIPADTTTDWGDDVLVGRAGRTVASGKLATDSDSTGIIYVGLLEPGNSPQDRIHVWQSTDGGWSWSVAYEIATDDPFVSFGDYELRVGSDANGTLLFDFLVSNPPGPGHGLWMLRHRPPMDSPWWVSIAPGETVLRVAADLNTEVPQQLFAAWETEDGGIHVAGSSDSGQTWGNRRLAAAGCEMPSVCAGGNGCVYLACNSRDSSWVKVIRYTGNLSGTDSVVSVLDSAGSDREWASSIAADRDMPCSTQAAVVLYCSSLAPDTVGVAQGWSLDGGRSWSTGFWPPVNRTRRTWDARLPKVRRASGDELFRAVALMPEPFSSRDSLVYGYSRPAGPNVWDGRGARNDQWRLALTPGGQVGHSRLARGGYITYVKANSDQVWFDGYQFVGIDAGLPVGMSSNPATVFCRSGAATVQFDLEHPARVRLELVDAAGRVGGCLFDGLLGAGPQALAVNLADRPAGVYCCLVRVEGRVRLFRVVRP